MPPKSRKIKVELVKCEICGIQFSNKDSISHETICSNENPFKYSIITHQLRHGFIVNDILVCDIVDKNVSEDNISTRQKNHMILLNPVAMKMIGSSIGRPVIVDNSSIFHAWPDSSLGITSIGMSESACKQLNLQLSDGVVVYDFEDAHIIAAELVAMSRENQDFLSTRQFLNYTSRHLDKKFLTAGNEISFSYSGKPCSLLVSKLYGEDNSVIQSSTTDNERSDITGRLAGLNLNPDKKEDERIIQVERNVTRFYQISSRTKINIQGPTSMSVSSACSNKCAINNFGGYKEQVKRLKYMLDVAFLQQESSEFRKANIDFPKGVLIYGPSGCGKSLLCRCLVNEYDVHQITLSGSDIWSKFHGESEMNLSRLFAEAKDRSPSIVWIDDIDSLCPKRDSSNSDVEKRLVSTMLTLIDDIASSGKQVFLLAATSKRDNIDPALRRPGRLDREIELPVPSASCRFEILKKILTKDAGTCDISDEHVKHVADSAHGFVGADLAALCKEACMNAIRRNESISAAATGACVDGTDLEHALSQVQPSAMREVAIEVPQVRWEDIGGQHELKHKLKQAIEWPIKHPQAFQRLGITPPKGLLMYGPPGCSKTMIAKALARESGINFIAIKGPELFSKWVGESERAVREVFRKARAAAPAIVFFDEIDALAGERGGHGGGGGDVSDRVLAQLLTEIDGVEALTDVTVVAATNRPDRIDKALLRPGRLDRIVYVPLPDQQTRAEIFNIQFRKMPIAADVCIDELIERTHRYSGAEVTAVCREAALCAMQESIDITQISQRHFQQSLTTVIPRITDALIDFYTNYAQTSSLHSI